MAASIRGAGRRRSRWGTARLGAGAGILAAAALAGGCDRSPFETDRPVPADPGPPPSVARMRGVRGAFDGGFALDRSDPPPPAGDLRDDVAHFTTLDACVAEHAVLDPLVGDAVRSIGYDTLLRDACRILEAIKRKDSTPCAVITASALERRCESLVAIALQDADRCPWEVPSQKQRGREPMCLAVATRDPRTCGAASEGAGPTCEALASGDPSRCAKASATDRAACSRDVERYRTILAEVHDAHEASPPRAHLEIHGAGGTKDPSPAELDLSASVVGGAVLAADPITGAAIDLARDLEASLGLPTRTDRPHLSAAVSFDSAGPKLTKLSLLVPRVGEIACPSTHCALTVAMPKADPKRGAPLAATIEGTAETPGGSYRIKLQIDTFVRDVVGRSAIYGGR